MGKNISYPGISTKTLENRLILSRNHKFHPKNKQVETNAGFAPYPCKAVPSTS